MTTRVHIVNFGPNAVSVKPEPNKKVSFTGHARTTTAATKYQNQEGWITSSQGDEGRVARIVCSLP